MMPIRHFFFFAAMLPALGAASLSRMPHAAELAPVPKGMIPLTPLKASSTADIAAARDDAAARLTAVRNELDQQAIGVILDDELELELLAAALQQDRPDDAALRRIERSLRRILPGKVQASVNDLRASAARLARMIRLTGENLETGNRALATVEAHLRDAGLHATREGESALRQAYAHVADLQPSSTAVQMIQRHLSTANHTTFLSRDFITAMSRRTFEQPVHFREHRQDTLITGDGVIGITLSASIPESDGENRLLLHAAGAGHIDATADRRRIHVRAGVSPSVDVTQLLRIRPTRVSPDVPLVSADFHTRLCGINLDGLLGQCDVAKRLAGRMIQAKLTDNDRTVAQTIEKSVGDRVREEGISLAYRVNGLLQYAVWDRLAAVDYRPHVRLHNDAAGMWSETFYAHDHQLAAVAPRPAIAPEPRSALDLVTWVHESAVTNALDFMGGVRVDEATARGLWEVQFKLASADWESLPPGRTPAAITLDDASPAALRFLAGGVELELRATSCEIDGKATDSGPCSVRIRYRIDRDKNGPRFIREPFAFSDSVPIDRRVIWENVLGLFFAREIRPMPRFPNANVQEFLAMDYLDLSDGWLVVGLRKTAAGTTFPRKRALSEVPR